jgi:hypothetical protein
MERVEFNEKNFGILCTGPIAWTSLYCPVCKKYHSLNFIPEFLLKGKKEYVTKCNRCQEEVITDMGSIEANDKLIDEMEKRMQEFEGGAKRKGNACLGDFK